MDVSSQPPAVAEGNTAALSTAEENLPPPDYAPMVDPFLVEALQNPRHRVTVLRMELDVQKFLHSPALQHFEFAQIPTSYLRLAAHRVAQHYGLQTMVLDSGDSQGIRILVTRNPESKFPDVCLSVVPAKDSPDNKLDQIKIVMRSRPKAPSSGCMNELGLKRRQVRTVEERKEEYDIARARIFSSPSDSESDNVSVRASPEGINFITHENEATRNLHLEVDKSLGSGESGHSCRVAILRDREKDLIDPDYDRSYDRYVRIIPSTASLGFAQFNMQKFQPQFVRYDPFIPQLAQMHTPPASTAYSTPVMTPYGGPELNQTSMSALYMQWPSESMMFTPAFFRYYRNMELDNGNCGSNKDFLLSPSELSNIESSPFSVQTRAIWETNN